MHYKIVFFAFIIIQFGIIPTLQATVKSEFIMDNKNEWLNDKNSKQVVTDTEKANDYKMESYFETNRIKRQHPLMVFANGGFIESKISPYIKSWELPYDKRKEYENDYEPRLVQELVNLPILENGLQKRHRSFKQLENMLGRI